MLNTTFQYKISVASNSQPSLTLSQRLCKAQRTNSAETALLQSAWLYAHGSELGFQPILFAWLTTPALTFEQALAMVHEA